MYAHENIFVSFYMERIIRFKYVYLVFSAIPTVSPRDSASLMTRSQSLGSPPQLETSRNNLNMDKLFQFYFIIFVADLKFGQCFRNQRAT